MEKLQCELLLAYCLGGCLKRGCPHLVLGNQCLGTDTKWCCVHTLNTRFVTVFIVTVQRKVRGKITVKNFSFFLRNGTKQTVLTVPLLFFLFRRALSSCCLQQTCPCKHPVSKFISVCNVSFLLQLFKGWIALSKNLYSLDNSVVSCHNTYPLDSDSVYPLDSTTQRLNNL